MGDNMEPVDVETNQSGKRYYKWRVWSRCVAYFDIIATCLILLALILFIFVGDDYKDIPGWLWAIYAVFIVVLGLLIGLSYLLIQATSSDIDPGLALKKVNIWKSVQTMSFILGLFQGVKGLSQGNIGSAVGVVVRGVFLVVVWKFGDELQIAVDADV